MIYLITGGQRSGKSRYAQDLALQLARRPVYMATARMWDEEFKQRVNRHKQDREENWKNVEVEKELSKFDLSGKVAVIDCITLWLTNYFTDTGQDVDRSLSLAREELAELARKDATLIFVTNEIGMGTHANSESGRKFTDLQGWTNQYLADIADKVILMVSGIPVTVKK